jgi:hypothetical protein
VGTWSYFIQYVQEYTHQPEKVAGYFLTGTLAAFGVGRFVSDYLMRFIAPNKLKEPLTKPVMSSDLLVVDQPLACHGDDFCFARASATQRASGTMGGVAAS